MNPLTQFLSFVTVSVVTIGAAIFQGPAQIENVVSPQAPHQQFKKIEWSFSLNRSYPNPYYYYDSDDNSYPSSMSWAGIDGVSVDLNIVSPAGRTFKVPGFWMEDYVRLRDASVGQVTGKKSNGNWVIRFSPEEVGTYTYYITAQDKGGTARYPSSGTQSLTVSGSSEKGFIRVSSEDTRFLAYSNGEPYVPIAAGKQWWSSIGRSYEYDDALKIFGENGVNLFRMWDHADFKTAIEGAQPVWMREGTTDGRAVSIAIGPNSANVRSGLRSASPVNGKGWYQRLSISERTKPHKLSVWIKTNGSTAPAIISVNSGVFFGSGTVLGQVSAPAGSSDWKEYSITVNASSTALLPQILTLNMRYAGGTQAVFLDDLFFGPVDASGNVTYSAVSDGDFERHFAKDNENNDPNSNAALPRPMGTYINQWAAIEIDKIVESAEANGVAIQLCSCSGPWFTWPENADALDYAQKWVLKSWQRNYRYRIARWGYSPAVFSWELYNEHYKGSTAGTELAFYKNLATYLRSTDPYRHLFTTSNGSQSFYTDWFSSDAFDISNYHDYMMISRYPASLTNDEANFVYTFAWCLRTGSLCNSLGIAGMSAWAGNPKPVVWGEIGVGTSTWDQPNVSGTAGEGGRRALHNTMWAGLFSPIGTTPIDWYIDAQDAYVNTYKYAERKHASTFFSSIAYDKARFTFFMTQADQPVGYAGEYVTVSNTKHRVYAMRSQDKADAYLWVQNRDYTWANYASSPVAASGTVTLGGLTSGGVYNIAFFDPYTGSVYNSAQATAANGSITLTVNSLVKDIAIRIESPGGNPVATPTLIPTTTSAPTSTHTPIPQPTIPEGNGDANADGVVNQLDVNVLIGSWFSPNGGNADQNRDGIVNSLDLVMVYRAMYPPASTPTLVPTLTVTGSPTIAPTNTTAPISTNTPTSAVVPTKVPTATPTVFRTPTSTIVPTQTGTPTIVPSRTPTPTPLASCQLTTAGWNVSMAAEGQNVTLTINGSNCIGQQINLAIYEDDPFPDADDPSVSPPSPQVLTFSGNTLSSTWKVERQCDALFCLGGDPEYYFIASIVSNPSISVQSALLISQVSSAGGGATPTPTPVVSSAPSEWTQHAYSAQRTSYTPQEVPTPWRWKWSWNGPDANGAVVAGKTTLPRGVQPVTGGGRVYVAAGSRGVFALGQSDANGDRQADVIWNASNIGTVNSTVAYAIDANNVQSIFALNTVGVLYKLNATTGVVLGSFDVGATSALPLPPAIQGATVYVGMGTNMYALNMTNLTVLWSYATGSTIQTPPAVSSVHGIAVVATADLSVHAVNSANGVRRWRVKPTSRSQGAASTEYSYGWPVIADGTGLVLVKLRLDWDTLFQPWSPWPTTNSDIKTGLQNQPNYQAQFAMKVSDGQVPFISNAGHGGWGDGGYLPMGPQPVVKRFDTGEEVVYTVIRGDSRFDGRWDSHYGEMSLTTGDVRWIQYGNYGWPTNSNHDSHPTDEQPQITMAGTHLLGGHWAMSDALKITNRSASYGSYANPILSSPLQHIVSTTTAEGCPRATPVISHYCNGATIMLVPPDEYRAVPNNGFYIYWNAGKIYDRYWTEYASYVVSANLVLYRSGDGAIIAFENGSATTGRVSPQIANVKTESNVLSAIQVTKSITAKYIFNNGKQVLIGAAYPHQGRFKVLVEKKDWQKVFGANTIKLGRNSLPTLIEGAQVTVSGTQSWYQGDEVIYVTDKAQLIVR